MQGRLAGCKLESRSGSELSRMTLEARESMGIPKDGMVQPIDLILMLQRG